MPSAEAPSPQFLSVGMDLTFNIRDVSKSVTQKLSRHPQLASRADSHLRHMVWYSNMSLRLLQCWMRLATPDELERLQKLGRQGEEQLKKKM